MSAEHPFKGMKQYNLRYNGKNYSRTAYDTGKGLAVACVQDMFSVFTTANPSPSIIGRFSHMSEAEAFVEYLLENDWANMPIPDIMDAAIQLRK